MKKKIIIWVKKKIIIWALIIVLSLSSVAAAVLLLFNNAGNIDVGVVQGNENEITGTDNPQAGSGDDIIGGQDTNPDDEEQDEDSEDDTTYEYLTIRFVTNGGDAVNAKKVRKGKTISSVPVTQKKDALFDGWYIDAAFTDQFYQSEPVYEDMTLYARYSDLERQQTQLYEEYTLTDQEPDLAFAVNSEPNLTAAQVLDLVTLEIADGSRYVALTASGNNPYTVRADGGFTPGSTYVLTLGEGLTFDGKPETCRECSFTIYKDEVMNLTINERLIFIDADDVSDIKVDGESVEKLSSGLFGDDDNSIEGTFTYGGLDGLANGSIACLYIGTHPNDRNLSGDYTGEDIAYVRITGVNGSEILFESLRDEDAGDVLFMPNTFPLDVNNYAPGEFSDGEFDFDFDWTDFSEFADMGIDADTTVDPGDFIALYDDSDPDFVDYFEIDTVTPNGGSLHITYVDITLEEMLQAMDYFTQSSKSGEEMLDNIDVGKLEKQIETQAVQSGFARQAMEYLALASTQTDGFKEISGLQNFIITDENGQPLSPNEVEFWSHGISVTKDGITVTATISNEPDHFGKGVQVALQIEGEYAVEVGDNEITINISATFVQEVSIGFGVSGSVEWGWYGFIPYIKEVKMAALVDIYDFTGISFEVKVETHKADSGIHYTDITDQLKGLLDIVDPDELDAGVEDLFEKYCEMLKADTDYIEIFNQSVFNQSGWVDPLFIIAYSIEVNFVIKADINIMLGANMEYMSGTRYSFWFKVMAGKAGSSTTDLIPETFQFQFYVMGKLGLKAGLEFKFAVGLFSTHLDSIGLSAEVGPYLELYGYFIYEYSMLRPVGATDSIITEEMMGALYIEFGIYFESYFNASVLDGEYSYSYPLYEDEWPLLTAGVQGNVYDFANSGEDKEFAIRDVKKAVLPTSFRNMKVLDLKEGTLYQAVYGFDKYNYRVSNPNFAIDSSGNITVAVPSGVQYMECDLTMTWKVDKLAFRKNDLTSTIHLVWTNLTNKELEVKYEVSVKVGSIDTGYTTVWSRLVIQNSEFELPSVDAIKALIGYDDDTAVIGGRTENLKYEDCIGYSVDLKQKVYMDTVYYFDVVEREYEITIQGVQNDNGTTHNQTFAALYHDTFDFSALEDTGTNVKGSAFTKYVKIDCDTEDAKQATDGINRAFAIQLLSGANTYTAVYADNSCKVTYHFVTDPDPEIDLVIADVVVTVEKGGTPGYAYWTYLDELSTSYMAYGWDTPPGRVAGDATFTAYCKVAEGEKYTITFDENGGTEVADLALYKGVSVPTPGTPTKDGYDFGGWYEDEALLTAYAGGTMPDHDFTLYAKWTASKYTVMFDPGIGNSVDTASKVVTFGEAYGSLPTAVHADTAYRFTGWYTQGDVEVTSTSAVPFMESGGITLYARYAEKIHIDENLKYINETPQTVYYSGGPQGFTLYFTIEGLPTDGFVTQYKLYGVSGAEYVNSVSDVGVYTVQVTRPADETYKLYQQTIDAAFEIKKAPRDETVPAPYIISTTDCSVTVAPWQEQDDYGIMMYAVNEFNVIPTDLDAWTTSCTIIVPTDFYSSRVYVFSKLLGGEFYEDAYSTGTSVLLPWGVNNESCSVVCEVTIGEVEFGVTHGEVQGHVTTKYGDMELSGFYGTLTEGTVITLEPNYLYEVYEPWEIMGIELLIEGKGTEDFEVESIMLSVAGVDYTVATNVSVDHNWPYTVECEVDTKRIIDNVGAFETWGRVCDVDDLPALLELTYDGEAVDQFDAFSDISYDVGFPERGGVPYITVELADGADEIIFGHCFSYSNYDLTIDTGRLKRTMEYAGVDHITFTATLIFPESTTAGQRVWTETITIYRDSG